MTVQTELTNMPVEPTISYKNATIAIADLMVEEGRAPSLELVASIRTYGIINPVTVVQDSEVSKYRVLAGRRRIAAATMAGLTKVPARIVTTDIKDARPAMTLIENATRTDNPAVELAAIETLLGLGYTEAEIAKLSGMKRSIITKRLKLRSLVPDLRDALETGKLAVGTAEAAAKLSTVMQDRLVEEADGETVTATMVHDIKIARRSNAMAMTQLPFDDIEEMAPAVDPRDNVIADMLDVVKRGKHAGMTQKELLATFRAML